MATPTLEGVWQRWLQQAENGPAPSTDAVCADCPELRPAFERRLAAMQTLEAFLLAEHAPSTHSQETLAPASSMGDYLPATRSPGGFRFLEPPMSADEVGRLGGYRILSVLGRGGMGVVFRAEEQQPRRMVALKVITPEHADNAVARLRFIREAQAAADINHDRVVALYRVGEANGVPFLVMPLLQGETLSQRMTRQPALTVAEVIRIGREIAEGLAAAHAVGLIHRDIKPANIWLTAGDEHVKILDFGLARPEADAALTDPGNVVGTFPFMAPEQANGQTLDPRADLFSLGCVLYRLLTHELPFPGASRMEVLTQLATRTPVAPHRRCPQIPVSLSILVMDLLERDRELRPATAKVVIARLDTLSGALPHEEAPTREAPRLLVSHRRRLALACAAVLLIGLLGVVGLLCPIRTTETTTSQVTISPTTPVVADPLDGELIVYLSSRKRGLKNVRVNATTNVAIPVREEDQMQIEVSLNLPAQVYILWLDGKGRVQPLYPWNEAVLDIETLAEKPPVKPPVEKLMSPNKIGNGWEFDDTAGLETILLLVRRTPLPPDFSLADRLGTVSATPFGDEAEVAVRGWRKGLPIAESMLDWRRGPKSRSSLLDDQLLKVVGRVQDDFELIRAVRFAHAPKQP